MNAETYTPEQQKANRKLWADALRSGEYHQSRDDLADAKGFCCLGVLAVVAGVGSETLLGSHTLRDFPEAMDFVGLADDCGSYTADLEFADSDIALSPSLAFYNDHGRSFAEIAAIIESEPPGLFVDASPSSNTGEPK